MRILIAEDDVANAKFLSKYLAKPRKNPFVDSEGNRLRYEDMNESQKGTYIRRLSGSYG